jgi:UDP-glucuronate decarboxylase
LDGTRIDATTCQGSGASEADNRAGVLRRGGDPEVKLARIFNTYGPNIHPQDGRVVSNLIVQASQSLPITVYRDGSQASSFCYINDLIEGFVRMMGHGWYCDTPDQSGRPVEFTVRDLRN